MKLARKTSKFDFVLCSCKHQTQTLIKQYDKSSNKPNCKTNQTFSKATKTNQINATILMLLYVEDFDTSIAAEWEIRCSSHSNRTPPSTSSHNSIRHQRFFDIIKPISKSTTGLQMKPPLMFFRDWVQKLFNCKDWKAV